MAPHSAEHLRKMLIASVAMKQQRQPVTLPKVGQGLVAMSKVLDQRLAARKRELGQ